MQQNKKCCREHQQQQKNLWGRRQDNWNYLAKGQKREKDWKVWKKLCEIWDNIHRNNQHIIEVPKGKEREKGKEIVLKEIIPEKFQIWWHLDIQIHVAVRGVCNFLGSVLSQQKFEATGQC